MLNRLPDWVCVDTQENPKPACQRPIFTVSNGCERIDNSAVAATEQSLTRTKQPLPACQECLNLARELLATIARFQVYATRPATLAVLAEYRASILACADRGERDVLATAGESLAEFGKRNRLRGVT